MTIALAMHVHCTPAAAAEMPFIDGVSLLEAIRQRDRAEAEFQAQLAGAKLR